MALFPVQGIFDGDFVVLLVPVDTNDPMTVVAEKIAHHVVGRRVAAQDRPMRVRCQGEFFADEQTDRRSESRAAGRARGRVRMSARGGQP